MTVTIADAEFYIVRSNDRPGEWAYITVDEPTGCFMAQSSFGTFAYVWTHHGQSSLKAFLAELHYDYFFGKAAASRGEIFSAEKTLAALRDRVRESRRDGSIGRTLARSAWEELDDIVSTDVASFFDELSRSDFTAKILGGDYCDVARRERDPQCVGFWETIWPLFLAEIAPAAQPQVAA